MGAGIEVGRRPCGRWVLLALGPQYLEQQRVRVMQLDVLGEELGDEY
jgi:hypothetical protein